MISREYSWCIQYTVQWQQMIYAPNCWIKHLRFTEFTKICKKKSIDKDNLGRLWNWYEKEVKILMTGYTGTEAQLSVSVTSKWSNIGECISLAVIWYITTKYSMCWYSELLCTLNSSIDACWIFWLFTRWIDVNKQCSKVYNLIKKQSNLTSQWLCIFSLVNMTKK